MLEYIGVTLQLLKAALQFRYIKNYEINIKKDNKHNINTQQMYKIRL